MLLDGLPPSQRLVLTLHRATTLLDRIADAYLRPAHGVTISMFAALVTIDAVGPARQSEVARALDVSRAAVSQRLVELVARGLVVVAPDPDDGRSHLVSTTAAGSRLLASAWQGLAASDDGVGEGVDLESLQGLLDIVVSNAERHLAAAGVA